MNNYVIINQRFTYMLIIILLDWIPKITEKWRMEGQAKLMMCSFFILVGTDFFCIFGRLLMFLSYIVIPQPPKDSN